LFSFFSFLFFLSCFWLWRQWTIPMNISNSGVGKYRTKSKNTILLTLASVNIFAKNEFEEEIFYVIFFLFILYYYLPFLDGSKKKKHCMSYLRLTVIVHRLSTSIKNTNTKKKNKTKCEGPTNKSTKTHKYFWNFLILKRWLVWPNIKLEWA